MNHGNGVSRGDRNRNARLSKLRAAVPLTNAIVGIDLADRKQMVVARRRDSRRGHCRWLRTATSCRDPRRR